jgi:hypothetical protein
MTVCRNDLFSGFSEPASRALVLSPDCPVPKVPGVYIWYFRSVPPMVPISDCFERYGGRLLYVGISPATNRNPQSRQTLRSRIRYHFRGNAAGSTLRRTLGVLLERTSGHALRRVGSGERHTLTTAGEAWLNYWLAAHALVCWREHPAPWELEAELMRTQSFPLNIQGNEHHAFYPTLRRIRAEALARARQLPVYS